MNSDIKEIIDLYIEKFLSQEEVKKYFILEKKINDSEEIKLLKENLKQSQKNLALSINDNDKYQENLKIYLEAKKAFESNPLIINYNSIKESIYFELKSLEKKIKE